MTRFSWKVQKPCFWAIFGQFCPMGIFSKKSGSVTHKCILVPNTMLRFRKKKQCATSEKTYGQTEGQTDTHYFVGSFQPMPGVQQLQLLHHWMEHSDRNFDHTVIKKAITDFFLSIPKVCQKWKWHINFFRSYWWLKSPEIWLTERILCRNLRLWFLPNLGISQ